MDSRPLLVSANSQLVDHVCRLAEAGGLGVDLAHTPQAAREQWDSRALVLIGDDLCEQLTELPKRRDVSVLLWQPLKNLDTPTAVWQAALALGAEQVVALPEADQWLAELLTQIEEPVSTAGRLLAVTGVCGGAGASTLAMGLAAAIHKGGRSVLLIDGDVDGAGIDLLLGAENQGGTRWPELAELTGRLSSGSLLPTLPVSCGIAFVSSSRSSLAAPTTQAWSSLLNFGARNFDRVVIDVPRHLAVTADDWWPTDVACELWCVVPTRIRPIAAAAMNCERWESSWSQVQIIARQSEHGVGAGDLERALGRTVLGTVPHDSAVAAAGELGEVSGGAFGKACVKLLSALI